ncbi:MAG: DUF1616 domain-containing protein [Promethearchaeota archaeon]
MTEKNDRKLNLDISNKHFQKIVTASLLIGIITVFGFIIYYNFTPEEGFVIFGILNENQEAENYPTNATVRENVSFFISVENYLYTQFSFNIIIRTGDNTTVLNASGGNGVYNKTVPLSPVILNPGQSWMSDNLSISFWNTNNNPKIIIFELWEVLPTPRIYNILWLRLNITT